MPALWHIQNNTTINTKRSMRCEKKSRTKVYLQLLERVFTLRFVVHFMSFLQKRCHFGAYSQLSCYRYHSYHIVKSDLFCYLFP
jgi:hypothetical protein